MAGTAQGGRAPMADYDVLDVRLRRESIGTPTIPKRKIDAVLMSITIHGAKVDNAPPANVSR